MIGQGWPPLAAALLALAACTQPSYLGATLPHPCTTHDIEGCLGWMVERDLADAERQVQEAFGGKR